MLLFGYVNIFVMMIAAISFGPTVTVRVLLNLRRFSRVVHFRFYCATINGAKRFILILILMHLVITFCSFTGLVWRRRLLFF